LRFPVLYHRKSQRYRIGLARQLLYLRAVNAPHLVAPVRAGATFINGKLIERPGRDAEPQWRIRLRNRVRPGHAPAAGICDQRGSPPGAMECLTPGRPSARLMATVAFCDGRGTCLRVKVILSKSGVETVKQGSLGRVDVVIRIFQIREHARLYRAVQLTATVRS
jgi:hypothetical protein